MTQGGNDPPTPLHRLSTAALSGVVRAFAYHRYFRFFLSLFFSTRPNEFFQIQAYLITDFDCWLCYFHYSARLLVHAPHAPHRRGPGARNQRGAELVSAPFPGRSAISIAC